MEHAFSILMFCFAGALLLYGVLLVATKDPGLIPRADAVEMKDKKAYAAQLGKIVCATSLAPLTSGLIAWNGQHFGYAMIMLVVGFVICIWEGTKMMKMPSDEDKK